MSAILNNTLEMLAAAHETAAAHASAEATRVLNESYGGQDMGACGFAWVVFYPQNKGNTRLGKLERKMIESLGFRKNYTGKEWELRNPSGYPGQNIDIRYQGARAYAERFGALTGVKLYACDRLD